jgi:hypothetical protein
MILLVHVFGLGALCVVSVLLRLLITDHNIVTALGPSHDERQS